MGAASVAFVVQSEEAARASGREPYAEIAGMGMTADTYRVGRIDEMGTAWKRSFEESLEDASLVPEQLGVVIAAANGLPLVDKTEARALSAVIGDRVPVTAPKSIFGEALSSSSGLNILAAIAALRDGYIAPTANLHTQEEAFGLDIVTGSARRIDIDHALVSSYTVTGTGNYHSLILKRSQKTA
jgi:3-oxoacyl-[acyl-carrier-protein] synthase II